MVISSRRAKLAQPPSRASAAVAVFITRHSSRPTDPGARSSKPR